MDVYDAVVVGAGAAGGWAAKELCEHGLSVLLLDAGPELGPPAPGRRTPRLVAKAAGVLGGQHVQARSGAFNGRTRHLFVGDRESPYTTPAGAPFNWIRGRQVGGRLHVWSRVVPRMTDLELKAASHDGHGADWPVSAAELAPYYDRVERFLAVERTELNPAEQRFKRAVEDARPDLDVAATLVAAPEPGLVPGTILAARATGRLTLRPDTIVRAVTVGPDGRRATGVSFVDRVTGQPGEARARAVVLCAGAIDTVRILLSSTSPRHPHGLGNSSGRLGRGLMDHVMTAIGGPLPESSDAQAALVPTGFQISRFQDDPAFLRGYCVQGAIGRDGRTWHLVALGEMLPRPESRVTLSPRRRDAWGMPAPHISCALSPNELAMAADQLAVMRELAAAAGLRPAVAPSGRRADALALRLWRRRLLAPGGASVPGSASHEVGGAGMGDDAGQFVLNRFNQVWDAQNVFATDGAAFVSAGWQNPTLTIMALTVRACEHLAHELQAGRL